MKDVRKASDTIRNSLSQQVDVLASQVADAEARCERENVEESGAKLKEITAREDRLNSEVAEVGHAVQEAQARIDSHRATTSRELSLLNEVEASRADEIPRIKHAISLYANITNIKFDYAADGRLRGQVAVPEREEVHPFDVDAAKCSGYEIAERLWGMMEA